MDIIFEKGINEENGNLLITWSNEKGKKFQEQWMGTKISYPLKFNTIKDLENIYSIFVDREFFGVIQQVRVEEDNIHIGRFLINPNKTGLGYGKQLLNEFIHFCFRNKNIVSVSLTVFEYNKNAKLLYETLGFEITEVIEHPELKYIMKKKR